jgi:hypothetical protein
MKGARTYFEFTKLNANDKKALRGMPMKPDKLLLSLVIY